MNNPEVETLYAQAERIMRAHIREYLELAEDTEDFCNVDPAHIDTLEKKTILLGGLNRAADPEHADPEAIAEIWEDVDGSTFNLELGITRGVYIGLRNRVERMIRELREETEDFTNFPPERIYEDPHALPIFQRLAGFSSKSELKAGIGSASDNYISKPASERLSGVLQQRAPIDISDNQLLQSVEPTLEGMVRDLVGRVLLEDIVANALDEEGIPYMREDDYDSIEGVAYDFRADFVIPNEEKPKAFIEVRKSSSRHASLYAKDKMFSAINWKGHKQDLLGIIVVSGPWTQETLTTMGEIFDYVLPLERAGFVAKTVRAYIEGDESQLRRLIHFTVEDL